MEMYWNSERDAKEISFQNAFNILSRKILDPSDILQFEKLQDIEVSNLVKDYQIQSEKINDVKYFANISVNFNKKKVKDFFLNNNIIINVLISEEYLVFPFSRNLIPCIYGRKIIFGTTILSKNMMIKVY